MSWWVYLVDNLEKFKGEDFEDAVCEVEAHSEGGTYVVGGTNSAELNITWNYGGFFRDAVEGLKEPGLKGLDGQARGRLD